MTWEGADAGPDKFVVVAKFSEMMAAEVVAGRIREAGIECAVSSDDAGGMMPSLQQLSGVKLLVPEQDLEKAKAILAEPAPVLDATHSEGEDPAPE